MSNFSRHPEFCKYCGAKLVYKDASYPADEKKGAFDQYTGQRLPTIYYAFWSCPNCFVVQYEEGKPPKMHHTDM